jgi:hypothetical protein
VGTHALSSKLTSDCSAVAVNMSMLLNYDCHSIDSVEVIFIYWMDASLRDDVTRVAEGSHALNRIKESDYD